MKEHTATDYEYLQVIAAPPGWQMVYDQGDEPDSYETLEFVALIRCTEILYREGRRIGPEGDSWTAIHPLNCGGDEGNWETVHELANFKELRRVGE